MIQGLMKPRWGGVMGTAPTGSPDLMCHLSRVTSQAAATKRQGSFHLIVPPKVLSTNFWWKVPGLHLCITACGKAWQTWDKNR